VRSASGCLRPRRSLDRAGTLAVLAAEVETLLGELQPDVVVVETPFSAKYPKAALALAEARGALLVALGRWGGSVVELEPARVKAAIVGHGRAEKRQVTFVVQRQLGLAETPGEDAADALALALCHLLIGAP
jgi:crossover junction endodeoxyribonuclease RuvC